MVRENTHGVGSMDQQNASPVTAESITEVALSVGAVRIC